MSYVEVKSPGRPPKWKTVEELQTLIDRYFLSCLSPVMETVKNPEYDPEKDAVANDGVPKYIERQKTNAIGDLVYTQHEPYTITGLGLAVGASRDTLLNYENELLVSFDEDLRKEFACAIKEAKQRVENYLEKYMHNGKNQTTAIFIAKNNFGWVDRHETDLTTKGDKIEGNVITFAKQDGKGS